MYSLFCIDIFLMKKAAADAAAFDIQLPGQWAGYFSEDRPLGWDPVAAGNRAGDGMARFTCVGIPRFPSALRFDAESAKFGKLCRP